MFKYLFVGHASWPPVELNLMLSLLVNEVTEDDVLVIPFVEFPLGSTQDSRNSMFGSAATP